MLTAVKNNLKFLILSLKCNLKSCMEYKKSFIIQSIFMIVNNVFFMIFWNVVFNVNDGDVNGIELNEVYMILALSATSWGIANVLFGGLREINNYILTGGLDSFLLQPKNILFSIATSKSDFSAFGDFIFGITVAIFTLNDIGSFLKFIFYTILGAIITCSLFIFIRTLTIWIGDVEQIARIYEQSLFITFCSYPYEIFGNAVKVLMYTIIPAVYVAHIPEKLITEFSFEKFALVVLFTIFLLAISVYFFNKSLKKYESGNNIAMKE